MIKLRAHSAGRRESSRGRLPNRGRAWESTVSVGRRNHFSGQRALVVEADLGTRNLCREVLEDWGFVVDTVDSGVAAIAIARDAAPDLILMDMQLRDVAGLKVLGWLRANPALEATPVIVLSAIFEDTVRFDGQVISAVLEKPLSRESIQEAIRNALK